MIRRRGSEQHQMCSNIPIDRNHLRLQPKELYRPNKFNYQIEKLQTYQEFADQKIEGKLNQSTSSVEQKEECFRPERDSLLRRKEWYNSFDGGRAKVKDYASLHQDRTANKVNTGEVKETIEVTHLRESSMSRMPLNVKADSCQAGKTIRKKDQICSCSRNQQQNSPKHEQLITRIQQTKLVSTSPERKKTEQDLDTQYQRMWRQNQQQKNKSFRLQQSFQGQPTQNSDMEHLKVRNLERNNVIVNTRNHLRRHYPSEEKYQGRLNYRYGWDTKNKEAQESDRLKEDTQRVLSKYSGEKREGRRHSPERSMSRRIDYGVTGLNQSIIRARTDWAGSSQYLPHPLPADNYPLLPPGDLFPPGPCPGACLPCPDPYIAQQTQTRLRMVEDFSSKISLRIRQLTTSIDGLRYRG